MTGGGGAKSARSDFHYDLPRRLIAERPPARRDGGRLLDLTGDSPVARRMTDFPSLLRPGDVLAVNNSRVIPARLRGRKATGGQVEILAERILDENLLLAQARPSRNLRAGTAVMISPPGRGEGGEDGEGGENGGGRGEFVLRAGRRRGALWEFSSAAPMAEVLRRAGETPLPPYIRRRAEALDASRYQTIFARHDGSSAAPTAGLHFSAALRRAAEARGAEIAELTLHVGLGTFAPVRGDWDAHRMHSERYAIPAAAARTVRRAKRAGRRLMAVGTTTLRALETSALRHGGEVRAERGETDLFIRPGFAFRTADLLLTNFHLPDSTLLALACAFGGRERVLAGYRFAVENEFRFFSYGDATLLSRG